MVGFRKKILISNLLVLAIFLSVLFPFVTLIVNHIMRISLTERGKTLISELQATPDTAAMVEKMKNQSEFIYQPVSLLDGAGKVIYHSYLPFADESLIDLSVENEKEVKDAIRHGTGFNRHMSPFFQEKYYYVALAFTAHGQDYILHVNFRASEVDQLKFYFGVGTLLVCILLLGLNSALDALVVNYILRPIQQIIDAIRPYKEGREELLPRIALHENHQGGEFSKLAFTLNSLTERIQKQIQNLKRQKEETEEILQTIGEGIIATDTSAKITFINQAACRMLEVAKESILKQTLQEIKTNSSELAKKCHELIIDALQTTEPSIHTLTLREKGPLYLDLISAPLAYQNGALLVLQDKTSDYRVVEMGKDFVANASHELRTPITIIRGFAETLQDLPHLSQKMLQEITEKIVRTCTRLDKLVRSLLTLSDIENLSRDRFRPADLILIAENCIHHLLAANPSVQIETHYELESAPLMADADLLELAVSNILENAVKYSSAPAKIEIRIQKMGEELHLSIRDQGIGISEKDLPHIFDRFYTVDKARTRKSGGAGLGLSIVKTILEKHRGKTVVESEAGKGSLFTLILPWGTSLS